MKSPTATIAEPVLHVGVLTAREIAFDLAGDFVLSETCRPLTGRCIARQQGGRLILEHAGERVECPQEIVLVPEGQTEASFTLFDVVIGVQFHWEQKESQRFVGALKLFATAEGVTAINVVPIEDYLASVISSEMSASSSMDLLKAHAITSRSWLIAQLDKSRQLKTDKVPYRTSFETEDERIRWYDREDHTLFDVCADDHCQRFHGITKAYTPTVAQAIKETRGLVLMSDDAVCDARFSKSCGGISEAFEDAWEPVHHPYLVPVIDFPEPPEEYDLDLRVEENAERWIRSSPPAFCNTTDHRVLKQVLVHFDQKTSDFYRWKVTYAQEELASLIRRRSGIDFGTILDLKPIERGPSGRMIRLKIVGTKRTMTIGKDLEIRRTLSPSHLYSSAFVVDKLDIEEGVPGHFTLNGAGWGHGVGLCQIGAAVMGELGYPYEKILTHYFTGAELRRIY